MTFMRKSILVSIFLLFSCSVSSAQDVAELAIIRSLLGVPPNTPVISSTSSTVPKDVPLKVFLEVSGDTPEKDKRVKDSLIQWLDDFGRGTGAKRVTIELASEPDQAQVALIHFTDFPTEVVDPEKDAAGADGAGSRMGQPNSVNSYSSTVRMSMVVYTYIVIKEPNALRIRYRRKIPVITRSTIVAGAQLTNAITGKLRKEIVSEMDKQSIKTRDEKNTKRSDYKLRDEFERWITSADTSLKSQ